MGRGDVLEKGLARKQCKVLTPPPVVAGR